MSKEGRLLEVADNCLAYFQGDGSWGWSNSGFIHDSGDSLLVDTLYDLKLTRRLLDALKQATPAAEQIGAVVNTHANGDHCYGNQLLAGRPIIATRAAAEEMLEMPPKKMAAFGKAARLAARLPGPLGRIPAGRGLPPIKEVGQYLLDCFSDFEHDGLELALPTETFEGEKTLKVGDLDVRLVQVGPAHTRGDLLVHVPSRKLVFTGDILFHLGHPVYWAGPMSNWIKACDRILEMEVETVVPGHGPLADKEAIRNLKKYLEYLTREARSRFDAGMDELCAARDIAMDAYSSWGDAERIAANVASLYREFRGDTKPLSPIRLFALMAAVNRERRR